MSHAIVAVAVVGLLVACGGGAAVEVASEGGSAAVTTSAPATPTPAVVADAVLDLVDTGAAHRPVGATAFATAVDAQALALGDHVRTDATGFAVIDHADGSVTRLDVDTEVEVLALGGVDPQATTDLRLDIGRVWNRVADGNASFAVTTDVGVAAVRGTTFLVECDVDACTFVVFEGSVDVRDPDGALLATLVNGQALTVTADGPGEVDNLGVGAARDRDLRDWIERNEALDAGEPDPGPAPPTATWDFRIDVTETSGACLGEEDEPIAERVVTIQDLGDRRVLVTGLGDEFDTWEGTLQEGTIVLRGQKAEDGGTTTSGYVLRVVDDRTIEGEERWSFEAPGGIRCPTGVSVVTATRTS